MASDRDCMLLPIDMCGGNGAGAWRRTSPRSGPGSGVARVRDDLVVWRPALGISGFRPYSHSPSSRSAQRLGILDPLASSEEFVGHSGTWYRQHEGSPGTATRTKDFRAVCVRPRWWQVMFIKPHWVITHSLSQIACRTLEDISRVERFKVVITKTNINPTALQNGCHIRQASSSHSRPLVLSWLYHDVG
jgi:hypothetical protein